MRPGIAVALCLAVALAGCAGLSGSEATPSPAGEDGRAEPTTTQTDETAAPTTVESTTIQTPTPAVPPDAMPGNTLAFENLSDRQQAAFRDALDGPVEFGPDSPYVDYDRRLVRGFQTYEYVRYEGQYYRLDWRLNPYGYRRQTYSLEPVNRSGGHPLRNLSEADRERVRVAISGGYVVDYGEDASVFQHEYVRYRNRTYRVERGDRIEERGKYTLQVARYNASDDRR